MEITRGRVLAQRLFDIAESIDLPAAERLVAQLSRRPRFAGSARHIHLPSPPLEMAIGPRPLGLEGFAPADVQVRLYAVGALVITFVLEIPTGTAPEALIRMAQRLAEGEAQVTAAAVPVADEIRTAVTAACRLGVSSKAIEDYTVFFLQGTQPACDAETLGAALDVPRLLLGETDPIADRERTQLTHAAFSYRPDDLVVVDWNSAVVLDPTGAGDVPELLELTNVQLLELRAYDSLVGRALDSLYGELDGQKAGWFRSARYSRLSRRIMRTFVDVSEITERIDNSLTFLGDSWLARVHRAAVAEFGIPHWQRQLRNKLDVLGKINEMLVDQITSQKSLNMEAAVVGLIVIEIVVAAWKLT